MRVLALFHPFMMFSIINNDKIFFFNEVVYTHLKEIFNYL